MAQTLAVLGPPGSPAVTCGDQSRTERGEQRPHEGSKVDSPPQNLALPRETETVSESSAPW